MKNIFKKYIPDPHIITENRWIAKLGPRIKDPNLWHLNRRSVSAGVFAGVLAAFIPLPIQIIVGIFLCFFIRGNLPVAVAFTWISNPLTYIPLYFFCYELGILLLGIPMENNPIQFDLLLQDIELFVNQILAQGWRVIGPLILGCTVVGLASATGSYIAMRLLWRLHIYQAWKLRREKRRQRKLD